MKTGTKTGKIAKSPHAIPGAGKKGAKSTPAKSRGQVAPQETPHAPPQEGQESIDQEPAEFEGSEAGESGVEPGELGEEHENEGGPCAANTEDQAETGAPQMSLAQIAGHGDIAQAIAHMNKTRGKKAPKHYDAGTNTYR